jgi:hypothetical protein
MFTLMKYDYRPIPTIIPIPPNSATVTHHMAVRITSAGMAAMAHFTIKTTMDPNGMRMSVTTTFLLFPLTIFALPYFYGYDLI